MCDKNCGALQDAKETLGTKSEGLPAKPRDSNAAEGQGRAGTSSVSERCWQMWDEACRRTSDFVVRRSLRVAGGSKRRAFLDEEPEERAKSSEAVSPPNAALAALDRAPGSCEPQNSRRLQRSAEDCAGHCNGVEQRLDDASCTRDEAGLEGAVSGSMPWRNTATGTCTVAQGSPSHQARVRHGQSEAPTPGEEAGMVNPLVDQLRSGQKVLNEDSNDCCATKEDIFKDQPSGQPAADAGCSSAEEPLIQRLLDAYDIFDERHQEFMQWHE